MVSCGTWLPFHASECGFVSVKEKGALEYPEQQLDLGLIPSSPLFQISAASPDCGDDLFQASARRLVGLGSGGGVHDPAFDVGGRGAGIGGAGFHGGL